MRSITIINLIASSIAFNYIHIILAVSCGSQIGLSQIVADSIVMKIVLRADGLLSFVLEGLGKGCEKILLRFCCKV
jgi:hypothetical protein